jgi:alkylhydroperoxidase/carboxymuconolactone decarboxylase family protein YurZ
MATNSGTAKASVSERSTSPWDAALNKLREWDPAWAEQCVKMTTNPWTKGTLDTRFIELVCVGLNAAHTNLNPDGTRRHVRAALAAGANHQQILFVLKCASIMSIHSFSFNAPILLQEASVGSLEDFGATRKNRLHKAGEATPAVEKMKAIGQWNEEWDSLLFLDPAWTDQYMAMCIDLYGRSIFPPKELELLIMAFDASFTNMYGPGTRRHIKNALRAGATIDEIMEVLKLAVVLGVQACNLGVNILAEELEAVREAQSAESSLMTASPDP